MPMPGVVRVPESSEKGTRIHEFKFDHVFWSMDEESVNGTIMGVPYANQSSLYKTLAFPLLQKVLVGYNACLFAYGMTSSGKTYCITGSPDDPGIIPRIAEDIFVEIEKRKSQDSSYFIQMSYYEIYNERIRDLLSPICSTNEITENHQYLAASMTTKWGGPDLEVGLTETLSVREHPITGPYVDGLTCENVYSKESIMNWLELGERQRSVAATPWNEFSSRSHTIFTLFLTRRLIHRYSHGDVENIYKSQIHIVDLAGSERQTATSSLDGRLIESCQINKSLFTLGKVISQLAKANSTNSKQVPVSEPRRRRRFTHSMQTATPGRSPRRRLFVSYRDSVLTWLLKDSLGGNAMTVMLATISPCSSHFDETLSTLRYAKKASTIVNSPIVNEDPKSRLIRELINEVRRLRREAPTSFEAGSPQAYEAAKLKELIMIREHGVQQLRRKLSYCSKSERDVHISTCEKSVQVSGFPYDHLNECISVDSTPNVKIPVMPVVDNLSTNYLPLTSMENFHDTIQDEEMLPNSPINPIKLPNIRSSIKRSLISSPGKHNETLKLLEESKHQIDLLKQELHIKSLALTNSMQKVNDLEQKSQNLEDKLQSQTRLLDGLQRAFDRLKNNHQQTLKMLPELLQNVAYFSGSGQNQERSFPPNVLGSAQDIPSISQSSYNSISHMSQPSKHLLRHTIANCSPPVQLNPNEQEQE